MDREIIIKLLAENIRLERLKKRLTQEKLADKTGLSTKYINSIETGKVNPSITVVVNICQALNMDLNNILTPLD